MEQQIKQIWPEDKSTAIEMQRRAKTEIVVSANVPEPEIIAAVDTAYGQDGELLYATAVAMTFPDLNEIERTYFHDRVTFPYIPGLDYYREGPVMIGALERLMSQPNVIIVDGHGLAHPSRCGMASQIGLVFDTISVGCARRLIAGRHMPVREIKGNLQHITLKGEAVGLAYRSKTRVKPIFISPGHLCDMESARKVVVQCLRGFRQPEPLRLAHLLVNKYKRKCERDSKYVSSEKTPVLEPCG